jgi:hypothetical protein
MRVEENSGVQKKGERCGRCGEMRTGMGCGDGPARQDVETGRPLRSRIAQRLNVQGEYASPLRSLRPCGTTSLNILVAWSCGGG